MQQVLKGEGKREAELILCMLYVKAENPIFLCLFTQPFFITVSDCKSITVVLL